MLQRKIDILFTPFEYIFHYFAFHSARSVRARARVSFYLVRTF